MGTKRVAMMRSKGTMQATTVTVVAVATVVVVVVVAIVVLRACKGVHICLVSKRLVI